MGLFKRESVARPVDDAELEMWKARALGAEDDVKARHLRLVRLERDWKDERDELVRRNNELRKLVAELRADIAEATPD